MNTGENSPLPTSTGKVAPPNLNEGRRMNEKANVLTSLLRNSLTSKRKSYCL